MAAQKKSLVPFLVLLLVFSLGAFILARQKTPQLPVTKVPIRTNPTIMPSPTTSEVHSPDGSVTLISRAIKSADTTAYVFTASGLTAPTVPSGLPAGTSRKIFTKTVGAGASMMIPQNTWAPEHRYVFLNEIDGIGAKRYYVVSASGEPFAGGKEYLDVTALFAEKKTGFMFREATGWASPTLLIITTDKDQSTRGPSYWFEIPSGAFLQLAR